MTDPTETNIPAEHCPGAEWVLKDIDRSIDYRKKYYEYSLTIATALLAFSISFPPTLTAVHYVILVKAAWVALGISILCGVTAHFAWSKFFISFRDFDNRKLPDVGKLNRKKWTLVRRAMEFLQFVCLLIGVMGMSIFAGINYQYLALHTDQGNSPAKIVSPHP